MTSPDHYLLGIDGGGTKTRFKLTDSKGNILNEVILGPSNPNDIGLDAALDTLRTGIRDVLQDIPASRVYAFAGIAGAAAGRNHDAVCTCIQKIGFAAADAGGDVENIISAGLNGSDGVILILGTGICAFSVKDGERYRTAGWGYLLDKGGSGYNYGCDALNAYYSCLDHTGEYTILSELISQKTGLSSTQLLSRIYELGKSYIASFAPLVFEAAEQNDAVAEAIISRNVEETVRIIRTALKPFREVPVPVVLAGGLTENKTLIGQIKDSFDPLISEKITVLSVPPVDGALMNARRTAGQ